MDLSLFALVFLFVLSLADSLTTHRHIKGGAREGNPIFRIPFGPTPELWQLLLVRVVGFVVGIGLAPYLFAPDLLREYVMGIGTGAALMVVAMNVFEFFDD
jgi:hypothetical protein